MKKLYLGITFLFCFFIFSFNVFASSDDYLVNFYSYDYNYNNPLVDGIDLFNYFEEMENDTSFYHFLTSLDGSIIDYLSSLLTNDYSSSPYAIVSILSIDEYNYFNNLYPNSYPSLNVDTKYVIILDNFKYQSQFKVVSNNISLFNKYTGTSPNFSHAFAFDSGANFLEYQHLNYIDSTYDSDRYFWNHYKFNFSWDKSLFYNTYTGSNFSYLLSKFYYSKSSIPYDSYSEFKPTLNFQYFITNNYVLDFDNNYFELNNFGLSYLKDFPLISSKYPFLPYLNMKNYYSDLSFSEIPDSYVSVEFDLSDNAILFPLKSCSLKDSSLFSYSSSGSSSFTLYLHTIDNKDNFGYLSSYYTDYTLSNKLQVYNISPLNSAFSVESNEVKTFTETDFINYYYRFQGKNNKSKYVIYYNPDCYTYSSNTSSITYTNPLTGNDITFSGDGSSGTSWKDPENINSSNSIDFFDIDSAKLVTNLKSAAGSFVEAGIQIVSLSTSLFSSLPYEVRTLLLGAFLIVLIVGLIKIIKDIL